MLESAVGYITERELILCVWNDRFEGWSLPGGKVEPNETLEQALRREMLEEVSVTVGTSSLIYCGVEARSAALVSVFAVGTLSPAAGNEPGRPVAWLTRTELLHRSPFEPFYRRLFYELARQQA